MRKWKTLETVTEYQALPHVSVKRDKVEVRPGLIIDDFYQVYLRAFVVCVPYLKNGRVLMLRQYKHGPREVTLTFPGGFVERDEAHEAACGRELLEETGCSADNCVFLGTFTDNGNQRGSVGSFFIANECVFVQPPNSGDLEEMEIVELKPAEIDRAISVGEVCLTHHALAWFLSKDWKAQH